MITDNIEKDKLINELNSNLDITKENESQKRKVLELEESKIN